jgi:squalene/oxidosqualene cyclase-like protein
MDARRAEADVLETQARTAVRRALDHLAAAQNDLGSWSGDYGGPMFLLPMYVMLCRVAGQTIPEGRRARMVEYLFNVQRADGTVGIHAEGDASLFTTVLCYVALRLLGVPEDEPHAQRMRSWILANGTALGVAPWGKLVLAVMNLYDYRGLNPVLPELWLLPYSVPMHPGRFWCHCRQVYLPMAYLYGTRARIPADDLCRALRRELYDEPYERIDFASHRDAVAEVDVYTPPSRVLRGVNFALGVYERLAPLSLRGRALTEVLRHIDYEDDVTHDIDIGPVNAVLNAMCQWFRNPGGDRFRRRFAALDQYLWDGHDGMKMQGYNSSQFWDTAFAVQAALAAPQWREHLPMLRRAHEFVRDNQILEDVPRREEFFRDPSRGGWPFSNRAHGWPITDCTSEGFKCAVALEPHVERPVPEELLEAAVRLLLFWQNDDGGWATYERRRAGPWVELLNPSAVFGAIMVDYSYVECTSACMQALVVARRRFPGRFDAEIDRAVAGGERFIRTRQRPDGSWEGSWAICFTYGTWFGVSGLLAAGAAPEDPALRAACSFLLEHQRPDGGWGEHHRSCRERRWVDHPDGSAANTAWALSTLVRARCPDREAMRRAVEFLVRRQVADGSWPREAIVGMFNKTTAITYDNYRLVFPPWALAEWLGQPPVAPHRAPKAPTATGTTTSSPT